MVERLRAKAPSTFRLSRRARSCRKKVLAAESAVDSKVSAVYKLEGICCLYNTCLSIDFYFDSEDMS
jgi:hypothetical protein